MGNPTGAEEAIPSPGDASPPTAPRMLVGRHTGRRYRLLAARGAGPLGRVYLAEEADSGRRVRLTVVHPALAAEADVAARLRRAVAAPPLTPSRILTADGCDEADDGGLFFTTPGADGQSLDGVLARQGPLPVARALGLAVQIGEALEAAHNAGIVHGNLTASQVVVSGDPEEARLAGLECGRLPIPAPAERAGSGARPASGGRGEASEQADIRAFGALLFEMLAGAPPPPAGIEPPALHRRRQDVPRPVSELVGRMLAAGPGAPPIDISRVLNELWAELHRVGPEAGAGRARAWRIAATAALALLVAGASGLLVLRSVVTPPARATAPVTPPGPAVAAPGTGPTGVIPGPPPTAPPPGREADVRTTAPPAPAPPGALGAVESAPSVIAPRRGEGDAPTPAPPPPAAAARPARLPEPPAPTPPRARPTPAAGRPVDAGGAPAAAPERPPARPGAETHDDGAIIDWLLKDASR